ncbi:GAF domain-containing protein [Elizabethkingia argentiflava]|uniref:GAF domain-containing protein n=1 Tax=Elizabethkingia argenteiflava TaxID=2681556 RepID=A0A845PW13_9FLAO|nr:GAF domain-containing protein [Elizabethkingia argenteiflava]NAW51161.1 GAF domain-containing protein [Elizabethkingia argenteiflava]
MFQTRKSPFILRIAFHKYFEVLENIRDHHPEPYRRDYVRVLLEKADRIPELRTGFEDPEIISKHEELLHSILSDLFPEALTYSEIKAVSIPFFNITFNYTERFKKLLKEAGKSFEIKIRNIDDDYFYILNCVVIIHSYFKREIKVSSPLYFDIPDKRGFIRHYRLSINADFTETIPTDKAYLLNEQEIDLLLDNYDNIDLWREKFPSDSWILKGFFVVSLTDVTSDFSLSELKSNLLSIDPETGTLDTSLEPIFSSYFEIPDLKTGFMFFNQEQHRLEKLENNRAFFSSSVLEYLYEKMDANTIGKEAYEALAHSNKPIVISDVHQYIRHMGYTHLTEYFLNNHVKSFVLIPVVKEKKLLAILEMSSGIKGAFNSLKVKKLDFIIPFLLFTISRFHYEWQNKLDAIIQREYTALHPSVAWKFREEAQKAFFSSFRHEEYSPKEVAFKQVYPLFGQSDIKDSSYIRNKAQQEDLLEQLHRLLSIAENIKENKNEGKKIIFALRILIEEVEAGLKTDTEQRVLHFISNEAHPHIEQNRHPEIKNYFRLLDPNGRGIYKRRKDFDETVSAINQNFANILEKREAEAQRIFPHYFELLKTDGVEHNIYIGQSICPTKKFSKKNLKHLRYWQLETICEIERSHQSLKHSLPYPLNIHSLVLVFNMPLSIRFRMHEKRFDVDGVYNSRYEVIKKRIDKAYVSNSTERITQPGKICIVYSSQEDEKEYYTYLQKLQRKGYVASLIEILEIEELPGVNGLKALRASFIY